MSQEATQPSLLTIFHQGPMAHFNTNHWYPPISKNPNFSERKMGWPKTAAAGAAVQAGRRPPRQRREAALTALGARCGTRTGAALSDSSFPLGQNSGVENHEHCATNDRADDALVVIPRYLPRIERSPCRQTHEPGEENIPNGNAGWRHPAPGAALIRPRCRRAAESCRSVRTASSTFSRSCVSSCLSPHVFRVVVIGRWQNVHALRRGARKFRTPPPSQAPGPHSIICLSWHGDCAASWEFTHPPSLRAVCPTRTNIPKENKTTCLTSTRLRFQGTSAKMQKPSPPIPAGPLPAFPSPPIKSGRIRAAPSTKPPTGSALPPGII
jgi:hypothetical protein